MNRRRFILYKINQIPGDGSTLIYLKDIRYNKPVYTALKNEALRIGLIRAMVLSLRFGFSTIPERLV